MAAHLDILPADGMERGQLRSPTTSDALHWNLMCVCTCMECVVECALELGRGGGNGKAKGFPAQFPEWLSS